MNWLATYIAAQLAQAAYSETLAGAALAFKALGYTVVGHYTNDDHQAFLVQDAHGAYTLAISGTRFGRSLGDLLDDADIVGIDVGFNTARVAAGPYKGLDAMWVLVHSLLPADADLMVCGHSLGGERALMSELFLPATRIRALYAFEAPKCGNAEFWAKMSASLAKAVCVINGKDFWAGWPLVSGWAHPPMPHVHLDGNGWQMVGPATWPEALDVNDHSIALVVERLGKIAGAMPA